MIPSVRICLYILCISLSQVIVQAQPVEKPLPVEGRPDSVRLLNAVTVEAYQVSGGLRTIPGSLSVISGKGLSLSDGTNLATTLNAIPGVTMQSGTYATSRIVIRGMGSRTPYNTNRIRAYLNDIPLTTFDGVSTPEEIDFPNLGRIEVIKGPASALFGSGLGGSINLFTPADSESRGEINLQFGSFNTVKAGLSGTLHRRNGNHWASISHLQSDGYRENNDYRRTSLLTTSQWKHAGWSVSSLLLLLDVDGGIPSSVGKTLFEDNPRAAAPNWKAIGGYKKYNKGVAGITLMNILSENLTNKLTVFGKWNDDFEKRPFNNLNDLSLSAGFRDRLNLHVPKTDLAIGTEWITERYEWKLNLEDSLLNKNRENLNQLNVFALFEYRPVSELNISIGSAVNHIGYRLADLYQANGDQSGKREFPLIFSPRIGINFAPGDRIAVYASAGHGYSLPSPDETLLPEGEVNPGIKPEQGMQYELGTRMNLFGNRVQLDATLYWIELSNLLVTKRVTEDIFTGINAGRTRHQGFELLMRYRMFMFSGFPGILSSSLSYASSLNRFLEFTDNGVSYNGNHLPGIPDQTIQVQLYWNPAKRLELVTHFQYTGDQYLNDDNSLNYSGYFLCNLKAIFQWQIRKREPFTLVAGINNLTGTHYASMLIVNALGAPGSEPRYYYPGLPRHAYAGIQLHF
jgi:iron complex outermembrane receptor protein